MHQQDIQWAPDDNVSVSSCHDFKLQYLVFHTRDFYIMKYFNQVLFCNFHRLSVQILKTR